MTDAAPTAEFFSIYKDAPLPALPLTALRPVAASRRTERTGRCPYADSATGA